MIGTYLRERIGTGRCRSHKGTLRSAHVATGRVGTLGKVVHVGLLLWHARRRKHSRWHRLSLYGWHRHWLWWGWHWLRIRHASCCPSVTGLGRPAFDGTAQGPTQVELLGGAVEVAPTLSRHQDHLGARSQTALRPVLQCRHRWSSALVEDLDSGCRLSLRGAALR